MHKVSEINDNCLILKDRKYPEKVPSVKNVLNICVYCFSLVRGPAIWGEVTVYWRIFPASMGEFAETSGKLTMREGQSAAIIMIQVLMLLTFLVPFALCVCVVSGWGGRRWLIPQICCCYSCDRYFSLNVIVFAANGPFCPSVGSE